MSQILKKKRPLPWWRRILLALVLTAMAMVAAFMLLHHLAGRQLASEIVRVSRAGEPITFRDLQALFGHRSPPQAGQDAAAYYAEALSVIKPEGLENLRRINAFYRKNILLLPASRFPHEVREKSTQNLANFKPMLEKFDRAASLPLSHFDIGIEQGMQAFKTRLGTVEKAVSLLSLRTLDLALRGEDDAAASSAITMLKLTRVFDPRFVMVAYAAKAVFVRLACGDVYILLKRGRASEKSLARLQEVLSQTIPPDVLERMFLAERVYQIELARNLIPQNITAQFLQDTVPPLPERLSMPRTRWVQLRLQQKAARYLRNMADLIAAAQQPWPQPLDTIAANVPDSAEGPDRLLLSGAAFVRLTAETFAFVRCTVLATAIERYRHSHGQVPGSLDDICPGFIDSIPMDPFTGKRLLYHHDQEAYVVYSVGSNRRDDGASITSKADQKRALDLGLAIRFDESK